MGNYLSFMKHRYDNESNATRNSVCYICRKNIEIDELVICMRCNIRLHSNCENIYRHNKNYCKCPNCNKVGSLGIKFDDIESY
jgi:hypothetical protein